MPAMNNYATIGLALAVVGLLLITILSLINTRNIARQLRTAHAAQFGEVTFGSFFKPGRPGTPNLIDLLNSKDAVPLNDAVLAKLCKRHRRLNRAALLFFLVGAVSLMVIASAHG